MKKSKITLNVKLNSLNNPLYSTDPISIGNGPINHQIGGDATTYHRNTVQWTGGGCDYNIITTFYDDNGGYLCTEGKCYDLS